MKKFLSLIAVVLTLGIATLAMDAEAAPAGQASPLRTAK